jgi:hypothetical protein
MTDEHVAEWIMSGSVMGSPVEVMLDGTFGKAAGKLVGACVTLDEYGSRCVICTVEDNAGMTWESHHRHLFPVRS